MKRRSFLKILPAAGITPFTVNGLNLRPFANSRMDKVLQSCDGVSERVLVLIQLKGGNDGLNTIVPLNQYDRYKELRPSIGLPDNGLTPLIQLDSTLAIENQVGLHPAMTNFKALYDQGWASLIQGVGYQSMNQSHFKGTDIWLSGGGGSYELNNLASGWMGRALNAFYPNVQGEPTPEMPDPPGIQLGDPNTSLGFHTETEHQNALNLSGQDPAGFYSLIQTIGGAPLVNIPNSDYGAEIDFIMGVENTISRYAQRVTEVFNQGTNAITTYPNSSLAGQLKTIARMMSGGCMTKIYLCQIGGFDTHSAQVVAGDTGTGNHANLWRSISDAVKVFMDDLNQLGLADRVLACTFSEFGRTAKENGSLGTDHGTLSPMFLYGKNVRAGVRGTNVNLFDLTTDNQLRNMQHDYRQVFASLLQDWLGANHYVMQEALFDNFQQLALVDKAYTVHPSCYLGGSPIVYDPFQKRGVGISPNPARVSAELVYEHPGREGFRARLTVHGMNGAIAQASTPWVDPGRNVFPIEVFMMPVGTYVVRLENMESGMAEVAKLQVVR
ncbi:MAG: DUF1501 domain-containing protein [Saprospiraceae bacterium]|nr:DUF1501 domain-containing protein [Saprospiraceae bacterium]